MGNVRVSQTVNINSGGSGGGLAGLLPLAAVLVGAYIAVAVLAAVVHTLMVFFVTILCVFGAALVVAGVLVWVFRDRIRASMVRRGDPRNELDSLVAVKREELRKIRAMRLQIEAARIAGVEITPDMLAVAEDPELAELVWRFKAAANGTDQWMRRELHYDGPESGPRGGE